MEFMMSIEKKFLKSKPVCKLKFRLAGHDVEGARSVAVAGEFNDWSADQLPLKQAKDGSWSASLDLEANRDYQFRYVINGTEWMNDPEADWYVPNGLNAENSVISL
jgi:1,4-alpha-glucan branching enzyme